MTYELLQKAPKDHHSEEFLQFLRDNNTVVEESKEWLIIENTKYHTKEKPHYTAFWKGNESEVYFIADLQIHYKDWKWLKKPVSEQTVKRFHIHLTKQ